MFRLEKVFQNDDNSFIIFSNFTKAFLIFLSCYFFIILSDNSIFELLDYKIFINSNYFFFSTCISICYYLFSFFFVEKKNYKKNFLSFLKEDILNIILSTIFTIFLIFILKINFRIENILFYLFIYIIIFSGIIKLFLNFIYQNLINKNIIQKNILLVGNYEEIKTIIKEKFDQVYIFKCCILVDKENFDLKLIKSELKFPIFSVNEDIRTILEYHSLGQIWVINGDKNKTNILSKILKFSVDTLNVKLEHNFNIKGKELLANKYEFEFYEKSRFYGINLFLKLFIDKILSIFFLILFSPILLISSFIIFLEDGFPIIFTQDRTGWDGRRFKLFKLRSLQNKKHDPLLQITADDNRVLKIGKFIRKYSIDEVPQFLNVLKGEMSIVGPRPHPVSLDLNYADIYESFLTRYRCNPGLTGWSQVNGFRGPTLNKKFMKKRLELDLWYLNNWSLMLDIYIIIKTFYAIFKYKGE